MGIKHQDVTEIGAMVTSVATLRVELRATIPRAGRMFSVKSPSYVGHLRAKLDLD